MGDLVLRTVVDGIMSITLNRPETRNAISDEDMLRSLMDSLAEADRDMSIRVVVLTGAGRAFCSGGNLNKMGESGDSAIGYLSRPGETIAPGFRNYPSCSKPWRFRSLPQ